MQQALRLLWAFISVAAQRELAQRANFTFVAAQTALTSAAGILALGAVFTQTSSLAGWTLAESIVLLGLFQVMSGLLEAFVEPNLAWFAEKVTGGELDDLLLRPAPALLLASLGSCQPWALAQVAIGLAVTGIGLAPLAASVTPGGILAALLLLAAGAAVTWASRVLLASLAFWAPGVEPTVLYHAFWQLGRYPMGVYHPAVRRLLTTLVPVAFITTIPAAALTRGASAPTVAAGVAAAAGAVLLARGVWRLGLRRYTSATS
jgi:ABC-2 type transport system permease protein